MTGRALVLAVSLVEVCAPPENHTAPPPSEPAAAPEASPSGEANEASVYADAGANADTPETLDGGVADAGAASEAPEPEPEPAPPPEPPTAEEITASLDALAATLREAGLRRTPSNRMHGWMPKEATELRGAWEDKRAIAWRGDPRQVAEWTAIALFGDKDPSATRAVGAAAPFEVEIVKVDADNAFLHVYIPAEGLDPAGGMHRSWVKNEPWWCVADHLEPGVDFVPFKSSERPSAHRQWARAWVVEDLVEVASAYKKRTGALLGIGDASLVMGGKMSDHWTHRRGVDVDVYLLDDTTGDEAGPRIWWHSWKRGVSTWRSKEGGKGDREPPVAEDSEDTLSDQRLRALAEVMVTNDELWFFVHDSPRVLAEFDAKAQARRPGRRFLHADNRAFWPAHQDHVHLRWATAKKLPVGVPPKP